MSRIFWAAMLAGEFVFLWWKIDWLSSLPAAQLGAAEVVAVLLLAVCVVGVMLPPQWAGGVQVVIVFFGMLALWGGAIATL